MNLMLPLNTVMSLAHRLTPFLLHLTIGVIATHAVASFVSRNHIMDPVDIVDSPAEPWMIEAMRPARLSPKAGGRYSAGAVEVLVHFGDEPAGAGTREVGQVRAGWPFRACESRWTDLIPAGAIPYNSWRSGLYGSGIALNVPNWVPRWLPRRMHPRPVWPGFLINTLLYSSGSFGALTGLGYTSRTIRAAHRRRRGRCPGCGYDVRGLVGPCPECGGSRGRG